MVTAKDDHPKYIKSVLPLSKQKERLPDASSVSKVKKKLKIVLDRGYISLVDEVKSSTHFFQFLRPGRL